MVSKTQNIVIQAPKASTCPARLRVLLHSHAIIRPKAGSVFLTLEGRTLSIDRNSIVILFSISQGSIAAAFEALDGGGEPIVFRRRKNRRSCTY